MVKKVVKCAYFVICIKSRQFTKKKRVNRPQIELIDTKVLNRSDPLIAFGRVTGCLISNDLSLVHVTWCAIALTELKLVIFLHTNG